MNVTRFAIDNDRVTLTLLVVINLRLHRDQLLTGNFLPMVSFGMSGGVS